MVIIIVLTTMTIAAVNFSMSAERNRAGARQVQSYLAGARDRAIYERKMVGVRFLLDKNVPNSISSMIYIEESDYPPGPVVVVKDPTEPNRNFCVLNVVNRRGETIGLDWKRLRERRMLRVGDRIRLPAGKDGFDYTIQALYIWVDPADPDEIERERIDFEPDYKGSIPSSGTPPSFAPEDMELLLPPVIRPNQEPMLLPRGIVIDGNSAPNPVDPTIIDSRSKLPRSWTTLNDGRLDIMFSPRGTVTGRAASSGLIHFYLAEAADVERLNSLNIYRIPSDTPYGTADGDDVIGDRILVTVFPQTGAISSHSINPTDIYDPADLDGDGVTGDGVTPEPDNRADDPYYYAETGEVAGE